MLNRRELKKLFHGCLRFEKTDGYLRPRRFTEEQMEYLKIDDYWHERSFGAASITLNFYTDAESFSFDYKLFTKTAIKSTVEVYQDGFLTGIVKTDDLAEEGTLSFDLKKGLKNVEMYLSNYNEYGIKNLTINGEWKGVKKGKNKVLFLGDSITQGGGTLRSGQTFVNIVKRDLNYEIINQGVAAYIFDENLITPINFIPKKIVVAFGTNNYNKTIETNEKLIFGFYKRLIAVYGNIPVLTILPPFRNDVDSVLTRERFVNLVKIINDAVKAYKNIKVVNACYMIPHFPDYFLEDKTHPNAFGAEVYAKNLIKEIKKIKF